MANIVELQDKDNIKSYPITKTYAVYDDNNNNIDNLLLEEQTNRIAGDITLQKNLLEQINEIKGSIGSPLTASKASDMVDTEKIYVYVGTESGYIKGNWYYYNEISGWTSGGVYNAVAVNTDTTLSIKQSPADSKTVGDMFKNSNFNQLIKNSPFVLGKDIGDIQTNRSILEISEDTVTFIRNSQSATQKTYGFYFLVQDKNTIKMLMEYF